MVTKQKSRRRFWLRTSGCGREFRARSTGLQTCGFYAASHNSGELCYGLFRPRVAQASRPVDFTRPSRNQAAIQKTKPGAGRQAVSQD